MPSQTAYASYLLDCIKVPLGLQAYLNNNDWKRDESRQWIVPWEERKSGVLHWFLLQWHTPQSPSSSTTWIVSGFTRRFQPKTSGVLFSCFSSEYCSLQCRDVVSVTKLWASLNWNVSILHFIWFAFLHGLTWSCNLVFSSGMKLVSVGNTIWVLRDEFCRIPISTLTLTGTYIHLSMTVFVFFHISHLLLLGNGS